jgi:hypothetical protein
MLLLEAGFGHNDPMDPNITGVWISLRVTGTLAPDYQDALLGFGCYPPALVKIDQCLRFSGRYDCVVQSGWIKAQLADLVMHLEAVGLSLVLDEDYRSTPLHKKWGLDVIRNTQSILHRGERSQAGFGRARQTHAWGTPLQLSSGGGHRDRILLYAEP